MEDTVHYRVIDADGQTVREGTAIIYGGGLGAELRYDALCGLPVGEYSIEPGPIRFSVIAPDEIA